MDEQFSPRTRFPKSPMTCASSAIQHRLAVEPHHAVKPQRNAQYDARKRQARALPAPLISNHQQRQQADRQTRNIRRSVRNPSPLRRPSRADPSAMRKQLWKTPPVQQIGADRRHRQKEKHPAAYTRSAYALSAGQTRCDTRPPKSAAVPKHRQSGRPHLAVVRLKASRADAAAR